MEFTKKQAISIVVKAAEQFRDNLAGRNIMFLCLSKDKQTSYVETVFTEAIFLHLTGFKVDKTRVSAKEFYNKCLNHILAEEDFDFADDHTTEMKLEVLPYVMSETLGNANIIGDFNGRGFKLFTEKLVGSTRACIGFVHNKNGRIMSPNTLINADARDYVTNWVRIIAIYVKNIRDSEYSKLVYTAKKVDLSSITLPDEIAKLIKKSGNTEGER